MCTVPFCNPVSEAESESLQKLSSPQKTIEFLPFHITMAEIPAATAAQALAIIDTPITPIITSNILDILKKKRIIYVYRSYRCPLFLAFLALF